MYEIVRLSALNIGEKCKVTAILSSGEKRRRLVCLGFVKGTKISPVLFSPSGGAVAYKIRGAIIALRREDARKILVKKLKGAEDDNAEV